MYFQRVSVIAFVLLVIFFIWMDINLYYKVQNTDISAFPPVKKHKSTNDAVLFSPFAELSVKLVMLDQVDNYIYSPLAEAFESVCT